jgi:hypothetical protein
VIDYSDREMRFSIIRQKKRGEEREGGSTRKCAREQSLRTSVNKEGRVL